MFVDPLETTIRLPSVLEIAARAPTLSSLRQTAKVRLPISVTALRPPSGLALDFATDKRFEKDARQKNPKY